MKRYSNGCSNLGGRQVAARVAANGGKVIMPKSVIPTVGELVRFLDTEGNDIGAMRYESPVHT